MKYLAVAIEDEHADQVRRWIRDMRWTRGVKEVVLDDIDGDTFETVEVLT
jgi:hypothetical protein